MKTKKIILPESQMPTQWYNIVSDMKNRPLPPLNPATKEPVTLEQMSALFAEELMKQEMSTERYIDIPEEVQDPEPTLSENIIKLQIADNHILSTMKSKSKSF